MLTTTPLPHLSSLSGAKIAPLHAILRVFAQIDPLLLVVGGVVVMVVLFIIFAYLAWIAYLSTKNRNE